jgi:hypothetical protein
MMGEIPQNTLRNIKKVVYNLSIQAWEQLLPSMWPALPQHQKPIIRSYLGRELGGDIISVVWVGEGRGVKVHIPNKL